jgi:hypothetical protein
MSDDRLVVRRLGRWQTLCLLCRIGCVEVAVELVARMLQERLVALRRGAQPHLPARRQLRFWLRNAVISSKGKGRLMR